MQNSYSSFYNIILLKLDKIISITLLLISIISIIFIFSKGQYRSANLPIAILFSSAIYLLFRDKTSSDENFPKLLESNRLSLLTHIIFFISVSLLLWLSWSNLYYRPPLYFVIVLIATASIIINIFCLNSIRLFNVSIVLAKITFLSYIIYAGVYYQFGGIYGTDTWLHNDWIQETINIGDLTKNSLFIGYYYLFPIFHLNCVITSIITTISSYSSSFVSCGFLMAMSGIFAFLVGRAVINEKAGLLAALIVPLTSNNIEKATEIIPMSLGYIFTLTIICVIYSHARKRFEERVLLIILSIALFFTHPIASLAMFLILIAIFFGFKLYNVIMKTNSSYEVFSESLIYFFITTMIIKWMQNPPGKTSFFDLNLLNLGNSLKVDAQFVLENSSQINNISYKALLFDQAGYLILLAFAIIGALNYLHFKKSTPKKTSLIFIIAGLFMFIHIFSLFQLENILPYRWYLFLYFPLSILAVEGIIWISNLLKNNTGRLAIVMLIILAIIFSMTTNSLADKDNPFFFNNAARYGYTQSEFAAIHTLSDVKAGAFVTDIYFSIVFPYILTDDEYNEMMNSNKEIFIQRNYYLQNPEWDKKYKISVSRGSPSNIIANYVLILNFMKEQYRINSAPMIYNNGNTKAYVL